MTYEEQQLAQFAQRTAKKKLVKVNERVYYFMAYGHSNATAVIGDTSVILIDTLDCTAHAETLLCDLKKITDKPVKTILYTHSHPDHRGGGAAFKATAERVIMHAPVGAPLKCYDKINSFLMQRGRDQFGATLTESELITEGLGIREGVYTGEGPYAFLPATEMLTEKKAVLAIDGVPFEIISAPGETSDTVFVYLPQDKVLCCGDNYYACWPNIYAIRGTQYRDVVQWIESLEEMLTYDANTLLPGHTAPLLGKEEVIEVITTYKNAIQYVFEKTLACLESKMTLGETVAAVTLPAEYQKEYLGEYYGTVAFAVKAIYQGYVGWFDGDPVKLLPVPEEELHRTLKALIAKEAFDEKVATLMQEEKYQLVLQLLEIYPNEALKKECLYKRAQQTTSSNARHYLMEQAKRQKQGRTKHGTKQARKAGLQTAAAPL